MKQSRIDFIKEAHQAACSEWKQRIEKEFPKLFEQEFKVGDWVVGWFHSVNPNNLHNTPWRIDEISTMDGDKYAHPSIGGDSGFEHLRKATPEEIETHLIKEAKRRGFKDGVRFEDSDGDVDQVKKDHFHYITDEDILAVEVYGVHDIIYQKGQWSEIIEETLDGKEAEIEGKKYKLTLL